MEVAIIILGLFIILLVVVIYKLGRRLEAKEHQIKAIKAVIEKQKAMTESTVTAWILDELLTFIDKQE